MRARRALLPITAALAAVACARFSQFGPTGPAPGSASLEVGSAVNQIHAAQYDIPVVVTLHDTSDVTLRGVRVSLAFDGTAAALSTRFRTLESDLRNDTVAPGIDALFAFQVEALPSARFSGPVTVDAAATWSSGGAIVGATTTVSWNVSSVSETIVTSTADGVVGTLGLTLRQAILVADGTTGLRRITFDPAIFPPASPRTIVLGSGLPSLTGGATDLMIVDGVGRRRRTRSAASSSRSPPTDRR